MKAIVVVFELRITNPYTLLRSDYNHEVLATEREPEGQAKRSKSNRTGRGGSLPPFQGLDSGGHLYRGCAIAPPRPMVCQPFGLAVGRRQRTVRGQWTVMNYELWIEKGMTPHLTSPLSGERDSGTDHFPLVGYSAGLQILIFIFDWVLKDIILHGSAIYRNP